MTTQKIIDRFPHFYKNFLPRFFEKYIPKETVAMCSDCSMIRADPLVPGITSFSPNTKCCTYYPNLPNYMVGALLADTDPRTDDGRARIRSVIKKGVAIMPHGVFRPKKFERLFKSSPDSFGRADSLVCPFFDAAKGRCMIWPFHSAVCNTWFCKYNAGEDGRLFWQSLKNYMGYVEKILSYYALQEMKIHPSEILIDEKDTPLLTACEIDDKPPDATTYRRLWGKWAGQEEKFYEENYHIVRTLRAIRFQHLSGIIGKILLHDVKTKHQRLLKPVLPAYLKRNPHLVVEKLKENDYVVIPFSGHDPLSISSRIYSVIDFFDGKTSTADVRRKILKETRMEPTLELILSLYQLRVLVESHPI